MICKHTAAEEERQAELPVFCYKQYFSLKYLTQALFLSGVKFFLQAAYSISKKVGHRK